MKTTIVQLALIAALLSGLESLHSRAGGSLGFSKDGGGFPPLCTPGTPNCPRDQFLLR
jgi:hypothetical protein